MKSMPLLSVTSANGITTNILKAAAPGMSSSLPRLIKYVLKQFYFISLEASQHRFSMLTD